jgi:hypothetical protein
MQTEIKKNAIIKLQNALNSHDWHYQRSEDPGVYRRGRNQQNELNILMTAVGNKDLALSLYNKACPWIENKEEVTQNQYSLEELAEELLDFGDSKEKAEGFGMMRVIDEVMNILESGGSKEIKIDRIYLTLKKQQWQ